MYKWGDKQEYVLARDNYTCQLCGKTSGLCPHHIDYNPENMDDSNLVTLCKSCNGHVNWNRQFWVYHFRRQPWERIETWY